MKPTFGLMKSELYRLFVYFKILGIILNLESKVVLRIVLTIKNYDPWKDEF